MEIQYLYSFDKNGKREDVDIPVRLNKTRVGTIKPVIGGWQYFPLHHKKGGEIYKTVQEVQQSLEFSDDV